MDKWNKTGKFGICKCYFSGDSGLSAWEKNKKDFEKMAFKCMKLKSTVANKKCMKNNGLACSDLP